MKIAFLGDIAFFGNYSLENNSNLFEYFKDVSDFLSSFDIVVGNLETPFVTDAKSYGAKSAYIKSHPSNVELLKYLHIDILTIANNHTFDFGKNGFKETLDVLDAAGILYFGQDVNALRYEKNGEIINFQGYCCYSSNPLGLKNTEEDVGINPLTYLGLEKFVQSQSQSEFTVAAIHCGQEHVNYPNYDHLKLSRQIADTGDYLYYGHHPHVAQGVERYKGSLIAHSLGNFCFDDVYTSKSKKPLIKQTVNNKESFILEIEIKNGQLVQHKLHPTFLGDNTYHIKDETTAAITKKLDLYNDHLLKEEVVFKEERAVILNKYINSRKELRNLKWYLKRLNFNSFFQIKNSYYNSKKYYAVLKRYLK